MPREVISCLEAPRPVSAYSQAVKSGGLLFLSGQIPIDPSTGELVSSSVAAETERVIENLHAVLNAAGASLSDVVKTTVFLTDMSDFAEFNRAYSRHFVNLPPARSTVAVAALPLGARVEIEAIAALP